MSGALATRSLSEFALALRFWAYMGLRYRLVKRVRNIGIWDLRLGKTTSRRDRDGARDGSGQTTEHRE